MCFGSQDVNSTDGCVPSTAMPSSPFDVVDAPPKWNAPGAAPSFAVAACIGTPMANPPWTIPENTSGLCMRTAAATASTVTAHSVRPVCGGGGKSKRSQGRGWCPFSCSVRRVRRAIGFVLCEDWIRAVRKQCRPKLSNASPPLLLRSFDDNGVSPWGTGGGGGARVPGENVPVARVERSRVIRDTRSRVVRAFVCIERTEGPA
mmetsp:Transcript_7160/g.23971  ORF Transcript_7160/g.23971 Transcript_7160/m.23971 type:complete len:204 (-) Transcript_7160:237-848(-)